jgi:hypothetical protein
VAGVSVRKIKFCGVFEEESPSVRENLPVLHRDQSSCFGSSALLELDKQDDNVNTFPSCDC